MPGYAVCFAHGPKILCTRLYCTHATASFNCLRASRRRDGREQTLRRKSGVSTIFCLKKITTYGPLKLSQWPKPNQLVLHSPAAYLAARWIPIVVPRPLVKQRLPPQTYPIPLLTIKRTVFEAYHLRLAIAYRFQLPTKRIACEVIVATFRTAPCC